MGTDYRTQQDVDTRRLRRAAECLLERAAHPSGGVRFSPPLSYIIADWLFTIAKVSSDAEDPYQVPGYEHALAMSDLLLGQERIV